MIKSFLRFNFLFLFLAILSISCTKNKNQKFAAEGATEVVSPSCGAIDMSPANSLYSHMMVNFEVIPPTGTTPANLEWVFKKGSTQVYATNTQTVSRIFNGAGEGAGSYTATAKFTKSDGNSCSLEKNFQILLGDICVKPSGISGPTIGYVGEVTSPFSIDAEPCFQGFVLWDMTNDGVTDYTLTPHEFFTHNYETAGTYTIRAIAIENDDDIQTSLTHTIEIRNKSCVNPFINAVVPHGESVEFAKQTEECGGKACLKISRECVNGAFENGGNTGTYTLDPATCPVTPACPATYAWEASAFGQCTGPCDDANGTKPVTNYICKKTYDNAVTTAPDSECISGIGAKPTGQTVACTVAVEDRPLNCLSCGTTPHNTSITKWKEPTKCGFSCTSQSRLCTNGVLPAFATGYDYDSEALCPTSECPPIYTYTWTTGEYGACSAVACNTQGVQTRSVTCTRSDGTTVADSFCAGTKPATTKACSARPCNSCALPWGGTLAHDASISAFQNSSVGYGSQCVSESRKCTDGNLSGSYTNKTCKVDEPANCTLDGVTVNHGQSRNFFNSSGVACGQTCAATSRTCNNGALSGNTSYNQSSCTAAPCSYSWNVGEYGACSAVACGTSGVRTRSVVCTRGDGLAVADSFCSSAKPATTIPCSTPACPINGACGTSNGGTFATAPTSNLCAVGTASAVSANTKTFDWTCAGANGGSTASCSAAVQATTTFATSTCGFGLVASKWTAQKGQPTSSLNSCEWSGLLYLSSSKKADAVFFFGDYYDTSGPYGIMRLRNPADWTITSTGCQLNYYPDPKNYQKSMPNYCKAEYKTYGGTTPLVWKATITAKNKKTGETLTLPMTATFKPKLATKAEVDQYNATHP